MAENNKKRITVTIGEDFYNVLKVKADSMGLSVSSLLVFYSMEHLKQENTINQFPSILKAIESNQ